jgi:hypothetical protein
VRSITTLSPSTQRFGIPRRLSPWRDRKSEDKQVDIINLKGGISSSHLTARIAHDKLEILEEMKTGKFTSVRAAGKKRAGSCRVKLSLNRPICLL